jgi:hypothetical protein
MITPCRYTACLLLMFTGASQAFPPSTLEERAVLLKSIEKLEIQPNPVVLRGPRANQQIIVTGLDAKGQPVDLTTLVEWGFESPDFVKISSSGFIRANGKNGETKLTIKTPKANVTVPIRVEGVESLLPVSFRHDVIAALNVGGCNMGACHGTPSGKNGFRLSLRGFEPSQDYLQLTRDILGRRTDRLDPYSSLILAKGMGRIPHEGSARFGPGTVAVESIADWLRQGMPDDATNLAKVVSLKVIPGNRIQSAPYRWMQLAVMANYSDGTTRDVTQLTNFSTSDQAIADVTSSGLVEFKQAGEVAILCRYLEEMMPVRLTFLEPKSKFVWSNPTPVNYIDQNVFAKLKQMSIAPSEVCNDAEFVRRVYLDLCGMLPPVTEAKAFLESKDPNKRTQLVDQLLNRAEFADFWALKWADVLRSSRRSIQLKGSVGLQTWLREHVEQNTPFDEVVRELLTSKGSSHASAPANYYRISRDPQTLAETTAQLFFGVRMQCAKCHNHPFERWSQDDYYSFAAWFARVQVKPDGASVGKAPMDGGSEVVFVKRDGEITQPRTNQVMAPKFLGSEIPKLEGSSDRREVLAKWMTSPGNPFFAKSVSNRVWFHLFGRGIVDPVDDFRESNPSSNDELLNALASDFGKNGFDLKKLIKTITASRTYQVSTVPNDSNRDDVKYFSHAIPKLLSAEQLLDAVCDVTGLPEKFAGLPMGTRAIQLPDGEVNHPFLKTFGQPARELACECERESDSNLAQALQLINGNTINVKLRDKTNRIAKLLESKKSDQEILTELYLVTVSRPPIPEELAPAMKHLAKIPDRRRAWEDITWALMNTREFLFRH